MKGKRDYIPFLPDKPKQGPKITRLFSWKKRNAEPPKAEECPPVVPVPPVVDKPKGSIIWRIIKFLAVMYTIVIVTVITVVLIDMGTQRDNADFPSDYVNSKNKQTGPTQRSAVQSSSGYCSSDADCRSFGARNGGPAVCGRDKLCHICYSLRGTTCISCSTGCDVNTYCEKSVCVFKRGGRTTD